MSTISNIQQVTDKYNFSIEKPTQSMDKKVLIEQTDKGLKIAVKEGSDKIHQVEKYMIEGLPKIDKIPRGFFESCSATARKSMNEYTIHFNQLLLGGGNTGSSSGFHACTPGTSTNHTHSTTTSFSTTGSGSLGASSTNVGGSHTSSTSTTRYYNDCGKSSCPTSSTNPKNK